MEADLRNLKQEPITGVLAGAPLHQVMPAPFYKKISFSSRTQATASSGIDANFRVYSRDLHSWLQLLADIVFIVVLSLGTGIAFHEFSRGIKGSLFEFGLIGGGISTSFVALDLLLSQRHGVTLTTGFDRLRGAAQVWTLSLAALVFVLFLAKMADTASRGAVLSLYFVGLPSVALWRVFSPLLFAPISRRARSASRDCIVVGDAADPLLDTVAASLRSNRLQPPIILKFNAAVSDTKWQQELKDISNRVICAARDLGPGEIFVCTGAIPSDRLAAIGRCINIVPRAIYFVPDAQTAALVRCNPAPIGNIIALEVRREPLGPLQGAIKRFIDIAVSLTALLFLAPFLLVVAITIKIDSKGPVFFRQTRNGLRGKPFKIFKFRSMYVQEDGAVIRQAKRNDPRATKVGSFLRKTSIDELPQLLNILFGEMSLVGPRPHAQAHDVLYARSIENYELRQHVKPGLTGWAQVNGLRGETSTLDAMYRRIEYDLWYAANVSILLDIEIIIRTAVEVVKQRNAY
jgi:undecaprenyl-phosphate galactose phosphotransferase/putative colanic acid biosynthesis UDP-glucose lipid carrier transferase